MTKSWWCVIACVAACSSPPVDSDDAGGPLATDGGAGTDVGALPDAAALPDVLGDAGTVPDGGTTGTCGDGAVSGGELCDGDTRDCSDLTGLFADDGARARCRADCSGYDVTRCTLPTDAARRSEHVFPATRDPLFGSARCNDGSPYRFEVSLTGSEQWIINFEGGGACDGDLVPCAERYAAGPQKYGTTMDGLTDGQLGTFRGRGDAMLSRDATENPTFAGANMVIMNYCSSDLWTGARTDAVPADVPFDMLFSGRLNARATLDILRQRFGLRDENVDLIITGGSAGGNGARNNVDLYAEAFPAARDARRIWLITTAGFQPYAWDRPGAGVIGSDLSDADAFDATYVRYGAELSSRCLALAAAEGVGPGACFTGLFSTRTMLLAPPMGYGLRVLDATNRTDPVYHSYHLITPARADYDDIVDAWEALMTDELVASGVRWAVAPANRTQGPGTNVHGLFDFWTVPLPAYDAARGPCETTRPASVRTLRDMITAFYEDDSPDTSGMRVCPEHPWPR